MYSRSTVERALFSLSLYLSIIPSHEPRPFIAGHGRSFVAAQCRSMPASCNAWWCASETPRRSASIAAICVARHQSLERHRKRRRRTCDRRRSTGSTELDTSDRWARGGMGARHWAHLLGCREPSRLPRPPTSRPPPTPASNLVRWMRHSWRTYIRHHRRRDRGPALLPSRRRRGPSDGGLSRHPTDPFGRSSVWPSRTLLESSASKSSSGSILLLLHASFAINEIIVSFRWQRIKYQSSEIASDISDICESDINNAFDIKPFFSRLILIHVRLRCWY